MATILSVIQRAAIPLGIGAPAAVFGASDDTAAELRRLVQEMAERITQEHDWQALKVRQQYTGDGVTEGFALPTDYQRMPADGEVWSSTFVNRLYHVTGSNDWLGLKVRQIQPVERAWTILGNKMEFYPALKAGEIAQFYYVSSNVRTGFETFMADTDQFILEDRILELGMIWQGRAHKGLPYAEDMTNYGLALAKAISRDRGARILKQRSPWRETGTPAWPGVVVP